MPPVVSTQAKGFHSIRGQDLPRNRAGPPHALAYTNLLRNVGTIDWYVAIPIAERAVPRYFVDTDDILIPNPEYRGEAFFVDESGSVASWTFRPNAITADVLVERPGVLVINQNHHPAWSTDRGELLERDGLIALRLSETGPCTIHLRYLPRSFVMGLIVTLISTACWALLCWKFGARALRRLSVG